MVQFPPLSLLFAVNIHIGLHNHQYHLLTMLANIHDLSESSGAALSAGLPDRGKDRERRGSLQLLPSRPALRVGTANPDPACNVFGHNRCYKPSLTVEEVKHFIIWLYWLDLCKDTL